MLFTRTILSRSLIFVLVLTAPLLGDDRFRGAGTHSRKESLFSAEEYHSFIEYLASDELEGRGTGQEGIQRAGDYIASYFKKCGVKPGGDNGTYFQNFTLKLKNRIAEGTRLAIGYDGRKTRKSLKLREDYVPLPFSSSEEFRGEVVFAGYGIVDDDYNDYKDVDVADKIVLVLRRAPKFREFGMEHQSFTAKATRANARNAAAVLVVNPANDDDGDKLFNFDQPGAGGGRFGGRSSGTPIVHIRRAVAEKMLKSGGLPSLAEIEKEIESTHEPVAGVLKGVSVRGNVRIEPVDSPVRNVIGIIPGTGPQKDEMIVVGGHYDHLGIRNKGDANFNAEKDISNGADDNASGTSLVMSLAKIYTKGQKPNRTLVLMCFTGEELGLLGSAHFASEPTIDLGKVVAMLNFDMVGRLKDDKLEVGGMRTGGFEDMVMKLARQYDLTIKDGGGGRGPSDHTSFYNKNIPVLFFFTGLHKQYHRPEDDTALINVDGAIRIMKYSTDVIDEIDAQEEAPTFQKDTRRAEVAYQDGEQPEGPGRRQGAGPGGGRRFGIRPDMNADGPGILIAEVVEGSPAEKAGFKVGDRIIKMGKTNIEAPMDMFSAMRTMREAGKGTVVVERDGKKISLEVTFEDAGEAVAGRGDRGRQRTEVSDSSAKSDLQGVLAGLTAALADKDTVVDVSVKVSRGENDEYEISFKLTKPGAKAQTPAVAPERQRSRRESAGARAERAPKPSQDPHAGDDASGETPVAMPGVRLGIMPSYGETSGEGYEISGVVEGGPAEKAGMKDSDRIYSIGGAKIKTVYEYMDSLRKYKPGDVVKVVVIRDGKKVTLNIKTGAQRSREAA